MSWDKIWKEKKYITDFSLRWHSFLSWIGESLPDNAKILEAGCGSGGGLAVLAGRNRTAIGLDISIEALAKTGSINSVLTVRGDNFSLPFRDGTFDLVFNSGVIEHFKYPGNVEQLKEMARVTKRGGSIIVNVPNTLCFWYVAIKYMLMILKKWEFGYEESYSPGRLEKAVKEAGLSAVKFTGFLFIPPLATNNKEALPLKFRKKIALLEKYLPLKQYYCYSVCVLCKKG